MASPMSPSTITSPSNLLPAASAPPSLASSTTLLPRSTMDAVFGTYELLESILKNLTMRELSNVQRVSTFWKDIIARSQHLQKRMWLLSFHDPAEPVFNDAHAFPPEYQSPLEFHPAFCVAYRKHRRRCRHGHRGLLKDYGLSKYCVANEADPKVQEREASRKYPLEDYSWRSMFATEPPVTIINVFEESTMKLPEEEKGWKKRLCSVRNPKGVTLGDVSVAAGSMKFGLERVMGEVGPPGKFGFVVVDPSIPEAMRAKLKPGCRFGVCEVCERLKKGKAKEVEGAGTGGG